MLQGRNLVVARMPLLLRILVSDSVTPLMYGRTAMPFWESGGSVHLKNIPTNFSGEGMTSGVDFFFKMFDIVADQMGSHLILTRYKRGSTLSLFLQRCSRG